MRDGEEIKFVENDPLHKQCYLDGNFIVLNVRFPYEIELSRCDTPEKILQWSFHLGAKNWVSGLLINRFINLACQAHNLNLDEMRG